MHYHPVFWSLDRKALIPISEGFATEEQAERYGLRQVLRYRHVSGCNGDCYVYPEGK